MLNYKIGLLRQSVFYLREVEREALVEIAFQMTITSYQKDVLVLNQMQDLSDLLIVYEGMLAAHLPTSNYGISLDKFLFEKFPPGSSYGLYSILKAREPGESYAKSRFKLITSCYSWVI